MGAQKSQPLWVDPDRVPPPTSVLYEQATPEVLFNSNGVPVYPGQSTPEDFFGSFFSWILSSLFADLPHEHFKDSTVFLYFLIFSKSLVRPIISCNFL